MLAPLSAPAAHPERARVTLCCPECGSDNVRRLELIYREGATRVPRAAALTGIGGIASVLSGRHQTMSSVGATPPEPVAMWIALGIGLIGALLLVTSGSFGDAVGMFMLFVSAGMALHARSHNQEEYPRLLRAWERTFMCQRCGERFVPEGATPLP